MFKKFAGVFSVVDSLLVVSLLDEGEGRIEEFAKYRNRFVFASDGVDEAKEVDKEAYQHKDVANDWYNVHKDISEYTNYKAAKALFEVQEHC